MNLIRHTFTPVQQFFAVMAIFALVMSTFASAPFAFANGNNQNLPNPSIVIEQCRNGTAATPNDCLALGGNVGWFNGNAGANNSHYIEGESIAYRSVMKDMPVGTPVTLTLGYATVKGGHNAIDYLTSYDRISENVDPAHGVAGVAGVPSTFAIPAPGTTGTPVAGQPTASFNALPSGEREMAMWNGTISAISYNKQDSLAVDGDTFIDVTFTPSASTVVLAWGGHIASRLNWGFLPNTDPRSAGGISGSSYHMSIEDWSLSNPGKMDRSLSAGAVIAPGNLIVIKQVVNSYTPASSFTIGVNADTSATPNSFAGDTNGTAVTIPVIGDTPTPYSVTETPVANYTVGYSVGCTGTVNTGENKVCTITNTYVPPTATLTLVKNVVITGGGTAVAANWTLYADGPTDISGAGGVGPSTVTPGDYTLTESTGPSRYDASAWECTDGTLNGNVLTLADGDVAICTITNTYVPPFKASITIFKTVTDLFNGGATTDSFDYFVESASQVVTEVFHNIAKLFDAGTYTVFESTLPGYDAGDWGGDCTNGTVTVGEGGSATCTVTNTAVAPSITITKIVNNGTSKTPKDASDFDIVLTANDINGVEAEGSKTFAGSETGTTFTFDAGSYSVTEPSHDGYNMQMTGDCSGTAVLADELSCTVTNTYIEPTVSTVNFVKVVENNFGGEAIPSDFSFHVVGTNIDVNVPHGDSTQLPLGTYTVTENGPSGYSASYSQFCSGGDFVIGQDDLGESRTCTVTNSDIQPELTVIKYVINDNDTENDVDLLAENFMLGVTGTNVDTPSFEGSETGVVVKLDAGAFEVTEEDAPGYAATYSADCVGTIGVGEKKTCTVTNNDIPPTQAIITVMKDLTNGYGGTTTFEDFSFVMTGYNSGSPVAFEADGTNEIIVTTAGDHSVVETSAPGYRMTDSVSCDMLTNVLLGFSYSCTLVNVELPQCSDGIDNDNDGYTDFRGEDPGCTDGDDDGETDPATTITIDKVVNGENADTTNQFSFNYSWTNESLDFALSDAGTPVTTIITPGQGLVITEDLTGQTGWSVESTVCTSEDGNVVENDLDNIANSVTLNFSVGEEITCVFTNHYTPRDSGNNDENIIIKKEVTDGSATDTFFGFDVSWLDVEGDADFLLGAGGTRDSGDLAADEVYSVTELAKDGWTLENVSCVSSLNAERQINPEEFVLNDNETITCTFTNDEDFSILTGYKFNDVNSNGIWDEGELGLQGWTVQALVEGGEGSDVTYSGVTDSSGHYAIKVPAGSYGALNEVQQSGWTQTAPQGNVCQFEVGEDDQVADCNFGNHQDRRGGGGGSGSRRSSNNGEVLGDSTQKGEVLGEATSTLPVGAPNTGAGGTSPVAPVLPSFLAILAEGTGTRRVK